LPENKAIIRRKWANQKVTDINHRKIKKKWRERGLKNIRIKKETNLNRIKIVKLQKD
jgi:hypothetical protein